MNKQQSHRHRFQKHLGDKYICNIKLVNAHVIITIGQLLTKVFARKKRNYATFDSAATWNTDMFGLVLYNRLILKTLR